MSAAARSAWHPDYMQARYENWVNGLNGDWCISRQRFFGVPFPIWYAVRLDGTTDYAHPILPDDSQLPIDPSTDVPSGFKSDQRGEPGGFVGDPDVMDTWATSSISPQLVSQYEMDDDIVARTFPMDLRPQAHDIIRTWLFSSVLRAHFENDSVPWTNAAISGWVLDPDRKKMSKSKGNVVTPLGLLQEYGSDGVRYWAARGGPGVDTAFDVGQMKIGRKLAMKVLNVSKFILAGDLVEGPVTEALDRGMLINLASVVDEVTAELEQYEYAKALAKTESFFWDFCDNYVEAAKSRRYGDFGPAAAGSASTAMRYCAVGDVATPRAVSCIHLRRGVVVVAGGLDPSGGVADAATRSWPSPVRTTTRKRRVCIFVWRLARIRKGEDGKPSVGGHAGARVRFVESSDDVAALSRLVERDLKAAARTDVLVLTRSPTSGSPSARR